MDATPSHAVNTFNPPRALGGAIDRLRAGTGAPGNERTRLTKEAVDKNTDTLLRDPVLREILGAGWQTVTYRQNAELMVEAGIGTRRGRGVTQTMLSQFAGLNLGILVVIAGRYSRVNLHPALTCAADQLTEATCPYVLDARGKSGQTK